MGWLKDSGCVLGGRGGRGGGPGGGGYYNGGGYGAPSGYPGSGLKHTLVSLL